MKKIIYILMLVLSIVSCSTRKQTVQHERFGKTEIARLSQQFGLRLTEKDNLRLYKACSGWLGVRYRTGGNSKQGVDCSGLVAIIYRQVYGKPIERNSAAILSRNCRPVGRSALREGDLVFFNTTGVGKIPTHTGIYLRNNRFIHAGTSKGVIVSSLSEPYYVRAWLTGGRVK